MVSVVFGSTVFTAYTMRCAISSACAPLGLSAVADWAFPGRRRRCLAVFLSSKSGFRLALISPLPVFFVRRIGFSADCRLGRLFFFVGRIYLIAVRFGLDRGEIHAALLHGLEHQQGVSAAPSAHTKNQNKSVKSRAATVERVTTPSNVLTENR